MFLIALGVLRYSIVSGAPSLCVGGLDRAGSVPASREDTTSVLIPLLTAVSSIDTMFRQCHCNRRSIHLK